MTALDKIADLTASSDHFAMQQQGVIPTVIPRLVGSVDLLTLKQALEASWDHLTSYEGATSPGNPALGQCYPTSNIVQKFYPEYEIARGEVWTGSGAEQHYWNVRGIGDEAERLDLTWEQFPVGSVVRHFTILDRNSLGDSEHTKERCALLLRRVLSYLAKDQQ